MGYGAVCLKFRVRVRECYANTSGGPWIMLSLVLAVERLL